MSTVSTTPRTTKYSSEEEVKFKVDVAGGVSQRRGESYDYLVICAVLITAVVLKKLQRRIHFPYTVFMFIAGFGFSYQDAENERRLDSLSMWLRNIKFHVLMVFVPAATVYATQGINHFIFRRCHREITVFSVGTLGISTVVSALYAYTFLGTKGINNCLLFGILLCSCERLPIADQLLEEGRYPILTTMLQAESIVNNLFVWSVLDTVEAHNNQGVTTVLNHLLVSHVMGALGGVAMGAVAIWSLRLAPQSQSSNTFLHICLTYATFCLLEVMGTSGVDGVVAFTLITTSHRLVACTELEGLLHKYWSAIYDVSGFLSLFMSSLYGGELLFIFARSNILSQVALAYGVRILARLFSVVALFPIIEQFGYPVSWRQAAVTVWMGLKGPLNITVVTFLYHHQSTINVEYVGGTFPYIVCDILLGQLINVAFLEFIFRTFGVLEVSEIEQRTMSSAVTYLKDHVMVSSRVQEADSYFRPVDWKWVLRHTIIENPFASGQKPWFNIAGKRRPGQREAQTRAEHFAVENVLRIEQVSYSRQYREGMIQKSTMMTLLAALQYPFDKKVYMGADTIESLIDIPDWIKWTKERLSVSSFGEDLMDDTESFQSQLERNLQERIIDMFEHKYYELVITSTTLTFLTCLLGMLLNTPLPPKPRSDAILVIEGVYIILFAAEITTMITAYGHRFVRLDNYNKLDLVLVATCIFVFVIQFTIYFLVAAQYQYQTLPTAIFILAMSVRLVHAVKYIEVVQDWLLDLLHRYLDKIIYAAYETSLAIITGEEEVQQNVWKYVHSSDLALETRSRATNNRLIVLRNLVEIQSRFPGIAVAFKSRQAGQTILNDVSAHVAEMQRDGFFTEEQHRELYQMLKDKMMGIICAPNSLPASYKPIAVLRVIPWIGSDSVRQFLAMQLRPVAYGAGDVIVEKGCESHVLITYSGIVKIEGEVEYREDGALPNSSSSLFFFSDEYFEDYLGAPVTLGALGLVSDEPTVTRVSAETPVNAYIIPRSRVVEAIQIFTKSPSFLYQIWYYIANIFGVLILQTQAKYQTWPVEKIKMRLSSFLLPDLASAHDFLVSPDIEDILLIQGTLVDVNIGDLYVAPAYIPRSVKRFIFPGDFATRPRPVIIVISNKQYKLPLEFDWLRRVPTEEERIAEMEASRRGDIGREYRYLNKRRNTEPDF
ncbi:sperm-specific sodium:proton exchanger-like [Dermacentor albipictus]|uniref:sperm-specific sodium:proton exchanger-like n=1 Tax=Dermacentor albipictus TaxID=60249 RepID=UPI0031FDD1FA